MSDQIPDRRGPTPARRPVTTAVVLAGGDGPDPRLVVPAADVVVAADSGAEQAERLGLAVDLLVGDLDSIAPATLAALEASGTKVERHPQDKDATDLELALAVAVGRRAHRIVVVGGHGGRLDHAAAAMGLLAAVAAPDRRVEAWMGRAQLVLVADRAVVEARTGELLSLVPVGGPVTGVTTDGLRWPLRDAVVPFGSTVGVSNEVVRPPAVVSVTSGVLAAIRPHALDPDHDGVRRVPSRA